MSELLVAEDFEPLAGHTLAFHRGREVLALEIRQVRRLQSPSPRTSPPFAVVLCECGATRSHTQGIWSVELGGRGTVDIFLVPVGPDGQGMCYEAVFN